MSDRLNPGDTLAVGQSIISQDGRFTLTLQADGNLVLYQPGGIARWATGTVGSTVSQAVMQADGNFVLYGPAGPIWATATDGHPGSYLIVQNDGNVVIYGPGGPLWATGAWSAIDAKYLELGGPRSFLGQPTSLEQDVPIRAGRFRDFQGGSIYWSPSTNAAYEVHGAIRAKYLALGGPGSFLAYPISDEMRAGDFDIARTNAFQLGPIYWTLETGAHEMHDEIILNKWLDMSDSHIPGRSTLGWPTSDVYGSGGSFRQDFQNGYITDVNNRATSYCRVQGNGCDHVIGGPPTTGVSEVKFYNCHVDRRTIYIWTNDLTAASGWQQSQGPLAPQYDDGSCPARNATPLPVSLQDGHQYQLVAVDPQDPSCDGHQNDPTVVGCQRWYSVAMGSSRGPDISVTIS